ncbi:hypothetical protein [Streptomyces aurantiogriseus]|uniref:Uncharacterized protein n=1 Tax=Streptomyces aurantiogriseus TaxID=66870 RepID=A0A918CJG2_9ACTN|nr:hypothetical protein [Streptomyces aurantiogriseus]GGR26231.1 hypothetical protein GCM10010251_48020 [Streptomyces aurantiogriseus]
MAGGGKHVFVQDVRRFFWLPRGTPRRPAPPRPLLETWLFGLAFGAVAAALGWEEGPIMMTVIAELELLRTVAQGVRLRWPAFLAALAVGWAVNRLGYALLPAATDSPWGAFCVYAVWILAALTTFGAVTRLPRRPHR